ncbi:MAG: glycosyltransferase, partial [Omnitrophica bacterium]|nr:glycosyltransferase [Candidatus Omnitrophota bacterium]
KPHAPPPPLPPAVILLNDPHLKKPYKKIEKQVSHYDFVFCAQKEGAEKLRRRKKVRTLWVPLGCDPEIHRKINLEKKFDVAFVGTEGKKSLRGALLKKIKERYPKSFLGIAEYTKISEIYSSAKIGFNYSIRNDINMRMFEAMSCGSLLLTNYIKNNGLEELLKDREHLVIYRNPKELYKLIDYYLSHPEEREQIAYAGHQLVTSHHRYRDRLNTIFDYIRASDPHRYRELTL